jgi:hypothetical protein
MPSSVKLIGYVLKTQLLQASTAWPALFVDIAQLVIILDHVVEIHMPPHYLLGVPGLQPLLACPKAGKHVQGGLEQLVTGRERGGRM